MSILPPREIQLSALAPITTPNTLISVSPFIDAFTDAAGFSIVPQQGTTSLIQTLGDKIMTPVVYHNIGGTESLWADQTVMVTYPGGPTAVRWYQFDVTGGTFPATPAQQQTFSNGGDGIWRFMPSIAVDQSGNTAIGYASSNTNLFPGIRYAGRLAGDPPNNLSQGEATMFTGAGSQIGTNGRWGDYSMTTIDPTDNMSFWTVGEYYADKQHFQLAHAYRQIQLPRWRRKPNADTNRFTGFLQLGGWTKHAQSRNPHGGCLFPG